MPLNEIRNRNMETCVKWNIRGKKFYEITLGGISVLDSGNIKREFSRGVRNKGRSRVSVPDCSPAYLPASTGIVKSGTDILNCTLQ